MTEDAEKDRSRLIDHFKRVYAIIAGLAITTAVKQLPLVYEVWTYPTFWLFLTFFVTIVPIFHGGDRSLDLKYLKKSPSSGWPRVGYLWDVYALLVTALLFVLLAEALPDPKSANITANGTAPFYAMAAVTLAFDILVLLVDWSKSDAETKRKLATCYPRWVVLNGALMVVLTLAYQATSHADAAGSLRIGSSTIDLFFVHPLIAALAFGRTVADYVVGGEFMFP